MPSELVQLRTYVRTFAALLTLLILTVGANFLNLGSYGVVVALVIAIAKAALILLFFMEVRYSHPIVWLFAMAAFIWLALLLTFSMVDYSTRTWSGPDWRNETNGINHVGFAPPSHRRN